MSKHTDHCISRQHYGDGKCECGEDDRVAALESAGRALLEWDVNYPKYAGPELRTVIERFRALLEPKGGT